jgi:hypothetical protein
MYDDLELLPADPHRGVTGEMLAAAEAEYDGTTYAYGMTSAVGAVRLAAVVAATEAVLAVGLGRDVALATLHGGLYRMHRDGFAEHSDTVVRESITAALEPACEAAGVAEFTDGEVNEVALKLSLVQLEGMRAGYLQQVDQAPN